MRTLLFANQYVHSEDMVEAVLNRLKEKITLLYLQTGPVSSMMAERWAKDNNVDVKPVEIDKKKHGNQAYFKSLYRYCAMAQLIVVINFKGDEKYWKSIKGFVEGAKKKKKEVLFMVIDKKGT